jgi:hypothetical protein
MPATTHVAIRSDEHPGEPHLAVVDVHAAHSPEAAAGELGLDAGHHFAERGMLLRLEEGIDVAAAGSPGARDVLLALRRVGLVPRC